MVVDPNLALVVGRTESRNNQNAVRFERLVWVKQEYAKTYKLAAIANECSLDTAGVLASCSWGAYQIMGGNLYAQGYVKSIGTYLSDSEAQLLSFGRYLKEVGLDGLTLTAIVHDKVMRDKFVKSYNGPGNLLGYWQSLQTSITQLGIKV